VPASTEELVGLGERLCSILAAPFVIDDEEAFVTVSAGCLVAGNTNKTATPGTQRP